MQSAIAVWIQRFYQLDEQPHLINGTIDGGRRQALVNAFQTTTSSFGVMILSPRAGGVGLTLTAANHVIHLSRWWNPAVEAQAIDRTHRIGQVRHVFAYRLIARDTVEEKVVELQKSKRALADAIISADNSVLTGLTRETLELLLS